MNFHTPFNILPANVSDLPVEVWAVAAHFYPGSLYLV